MTMSAPPRRSKPGLTGDSHADLEALAAWCRDEEGLAVGNMNPNAQGRVAAAPALLTDAEHLRLRSAVGDAIVTLGRLIGVGVVEQLRRDYDEVASQAWTLDRIAAAQAERIPLLEQLLADALGGRDSARRIACALEAELAAWRNASWLGVYTSLLEARVTETDRDWCVGRANELAAAAQATTETLEAGMLPVVDDATLPEHALQFRAGDRLVAVGYLERLFAPLDTATEIALGATETPLEGDPSPLDDLDASTPFRASWADGTEWAASEDTPGAWLLLSTPQHDGEWAHVAPPVFDETVGSLRVVVGHLWGPFGGEAPQPQPPGPPTPPRPAGHHPVA
jgi:hypothetical protein